MSDNDTDFDSLFDTASPNSSSDFAPMDESRVRAIARDQHFRDIASMQQGAFALEQRRQEALQRAEERNSGFQKLYGDAQVTARFKEENPRHSRWIFAAESGVGDEGDLDELYSQFYATASQYKPEPEHKLSAAKQTPRPASAFTLDAINALPPEKRRGSIEALKEKLGDTSLDEADPENHRFKIERGETEK